MSDTMVEVKDFAPLTGQETNPNIPKMFMVTLDPDNVSAKVIVNWGDGVITDYNNVIGQQELYHTFPRRGVYDITAQTENGTVVKNYRFYLR